MRLPPRTLQAGVRPGFTLIEMLVVMVVVAIALGLTLPGLGRDEREAQVRAAADELASTLRKTRNMAMARGTMYGVAFNIQNDPDSSGRILNNRTGGHWYRIIGPSDTSYFDVQGGCLPTAGNQGGSTVNLYNNLANLPDFTEEVARCWAGERVVLPPKRVRFLALSDTDEGPRVRKAKYNDAGTVLYGAGGERTYPRPWCGWWDSSTGQLWPWGGRGASSATAATTSAFWYQGDEAAFPDSRNPTDRAFTQYWDLNGDTFVTGVGETVPGYKVLVANTPRPLVNADWLDAVIAFLPSGQATYLQWNRARRTYANVQAVPNDNTDYESYTGLWSNGVGDMAKSSVTGYDTTEVVHFTTHTGGWFITLGPDAQNDTCTFASAREAIASITPAWRVYVGTWGSIRTLRVRNQPLTGLKLWPPLPTDWTSTSGGAGNTVWKNCRPGWLHKPNTTDSVYPSRQIPRGRPVVDMINEQMIANRQWWIDD